MAFQLQINALTPRGEVMGTFGGIDDERAEIDELGRALRDRINDLSHITIVHQGQLVCLNKQILQQSILIFSTIEVQA
jgi:sorbitol-specific phosphotransferase system component IIA